MGDNRLAPLVLSDSERRTLQGWATRRKTAQGLALLIAPLDLRARHSDTLGRAPELLYTRDIAEQVAVLYWPQVIPYLVPGSASAVELRQIT